MCTCVSIFQSILHGLIVSTLGPNAYASMTSPSGIRQPFLTKVSPLNSAAIDPKYTHTLYGGLSVKTKTYLIPLP